MADEAPINPSQRPPSGPFRNPGVLFATVMVGVIAVVIAVILAGGEDEGATETVGAETGCETVEQPAPKSVSLPAPEAKRPTASTIVFDTSCGSFTVALDAERAPKTAASFQYLAEEGVFDGTPFHRIASGFVIQGGDPNGDGSGGPGYSVQETPPPNLTYSRGVVAMAKTDAEPPGTSGSQFFVVTADADAGLPPDFALVGEVSQGFETIAAIEAQGTPGSDGPPAMPVIIESAAAQS